MRKVTAPSWKEVRGTTTVVIITVFLFAAYFWRGRFRHSAQRVTALLRYFWHALARDRGKDERCPRRSNLTMQDEEKNQKHSQRGQ